ncbi:uncharacterized protein LOC111116363 [Crassostrea virginica]
MEMRWILFLLCECITGQDLLKRCHIKRNSILCKNTWGPLACNRVQQAAEMLVLRNVFVTRVNLTRTCFPRLRTAIIDRSRNVNCEDFPLDVNVTIDGRDCITDMTTQTDNVTTTAATTTTTRKKPIKKKTTTRAPQTTTTNTTENATYEFTTTTQQPPFTQQEKNLMTATVVLMLGGLLGALCIFFAVVMVVHKVCLRRRGKPRKIPPAVNLGSLEAGRGLGSVSSGSSETLFQRVKLD